MQEILDKLLQLIWGVWRFRWTVLVVAWLMAVAGWMVVGKMDDKYRATARVFVDSNRILAPLMKGIAIQPDVEARVSLMSKTLLSRPNLEKLMRMSDLDIQAKNEKELAAQRANLAKNLRLSSGRRSNIYSVSYIHGDPETAKRVVQSLITIFIETTLGEERQDSSTAQLFLEDQISEYENRLSEAEQRRSAFRRKHVGTMPSEAGGYYQRLNSAIAQLRTARLELREADNRRLDLQRQLASESPGIIQQQVDAQDPQEIQLNAYKEQLRALLVRYTERHPQIYQLREAIALLEARKQVNSRNASSSGQQRLISSPVYQQMKSSLSETEARIAELRVRVVDFENQVDELKGTIDSIPKVEAQLQQLDRDYNTIKQQHSTLLARRESARLSEKVEQAEDVTFRVIDPPYVPAKPSEPNRFILNAFVLVASVGAGVGLSLLFSLIRPVYYSQRSLGSVTGLPILGSVSLVSETGARIRVWLGRFTYGSLAGALMIAFLGLTYITKHGDSSALLQRIEKNEMVSRVKDSRLVRAVEESRVFKKLSDIGQDLI